MNDSGAAPCPCPHPKRKRVELVIGPTVYVRCVWCFATLSERRRDEQGEAVTVYTSMTRAARADDVLHVSQPSPFPAP
jgi:hypothetical protein